MSNKKDLNVAPFYDDFNEEKNFHQILFKPGYAVQARELTQLQSILRNQIDKFGRNIFKNGSIVIPGSTMGELGVKFCEIQNSSNSLSGIVGKILVGSTNGIKAILKHVVIDSTGTNKTRFYLSYISGSGDAGKTEFELDETIYLEDIPSQTYSVNTNVLTTFGKGSLAHIDTGVYFINGNFVTVSAQTTVIDANSDLPSARVMLKLTETLVNSDQDESLLDPSQGTNNFAAPGAERLKIGLELISLSLTETINDDYIELMRYEEGILVEHSRTPKYNEIEKSLARRTYDESGDYVVSGLKTKVREHLKTGSNNGLSVTGSKDNFVVEVSSGKAYVGGFESEKISTNYLVTEKARTTQEKTFSLRPNYGQYVYISMISGSGPKISELEQVNLYDSSSVGTVIGHARIAFIDYKIGVVTDPKCIYEAILTDVSFISPTYSFENVATILSSNFNAVLVHILNVPKSSGGSYAQDDVITYNTSTRMAKVLYWDSSKSDLYVYKHNSTTPTPIVGDLIQNGSGVNGIVKMKTTVGTNQQSGFLFRLPVDYVKSLKNSSLTYNNNYTVQKELNITLPTKSVSISSGTIRKPEIGTFLAFRTLSGVTTPLAPDDFSVSGNNLTYNGLLDTGTIKCFVAVDKENIIPKTKTKTEHTDDIVAPLKNKLTLSKSDCFRIISITDSEQGDVTTKYIMNNGQTDYSYQLSTLTPVSGFGAKGDISVVYEYLEHSSTGDYFSADSYVGLTTSDISAPDLNLSYTNSQGKKYNLMNCLDFRSTVNSSNDFSAGAIVNDLIINGEEYRSDVQFYVPRIDLLVLDRANTLSIIKGTPAEQPKPPNVSSDVLVLEAFFVPAYTKNVTKIQNTRLSVDRKTMKDISNMSDRIRQIEEYSTLNAVETDLVNTEVVDPTTGLNRFKSGYLVESFNRPFTISDVSNEDFAVTFLDSKMMPAVESMQCMLSIDSTSVNYSNKNNGYITLPYIEVDFAKQPMSSRTTNLNPFLFVKWNGILNVTPNIDNWVEIVDKPIILQEKSEQNFVYVTKVLPAPVPAPTMPICPNQLVNPVIGSHNGNLSSMNRSDNSSEGGSIGSGIGRNMDGSATIGGIGIGRTTLGVRASPSSDSTAVGGLTNGSFAGAASGFGGDD